MEQGYNVAANQEIPEEFYNQKTVFCPICGQSFSTSSYLFDAISNKRTAMFANLVTHYRHHHINYWDKCWGYRGSYYRRNWFSDYETEKSKVNESSKRQIIRKAHKFLIERGFTVEDLMEMDRNHPDTIKIIEKYLPSKNKLSEVA